MNKTKGSVENPKGSGGEHHSKIKRSSDESKDSKSAGSNYYSTGGTEPHRVSRFVDLLSNDERKKLKTIAKELMEPGKGIFTMDETIDELGTQLEEIGLPNNPTNRLDYIMSLLGDCTQWRLYISGVVLRESVFGLLRKRELRKTVLKALGDRRVHIGIKINQDYCQYLAGTDKEVTSSGIDTLSQNCVRLKEMGVSFTMMHCVFDVNEYTPSALTYSVSANTLARGASICQKAELVPILSIEISRGHCCSSSHHSSSNSSYQEEGDECSRSSQGQQQQTQYLSERLKLTENILAFLVKALADHHVYLEGVLIRLSPVLTLSPEVQSITMATLTAINNCIPPALGGVLLSDDALGLAESIDILNQINLTICPKSGLVSFAWGQGIKDGLMEAWRDGQDEKIKNESNKAVELMSERLKMCSEATMGQRPKDQHTFFITKDPDTKPVLPW